MGSKDRDYFIEGLAALIDFDIDVKQENGLLEAVNRRLRKNWLIVGKNMRNALKDYGEIETKER